MEITITILIGAAMVITSIVDFAKPWYKDLVGRWETTINIALSFILWVCSAFAVRPYLEIDLNVGALILLWLALGTGANIFYDIWKLVQNLGSVKKEEVAEEKPSAIWYDLTPNEEEKDE
jgi:hypothetical protein